MRKIRVANPTDKSTWRHAYLLALGQIHPTYLYVYANSLEAAFDESAYWCEKNAPGMLLSQELGEQYKLAKNRGLPDDAAYEYAHQDTIQCDGGLTFASDDLRIVFEDPSQADLIAFAKGL